MSRRRSGFSLIEILVVIAIIAILIALLSSAVHTVRESANLIKCRNNLKQIGIAFNTFVSTNRTYPGGGHNWDSPITYTEPAPVPDPSIDPTLDPSLIPVPTGTPVIGKTQKVGWAFQILPFMEQSNVYILRDDTKWPEEPGLVAKSIIPDYLCPTRRGPELLDSGRAPLDYATAIPGLWTSADGNRDHIDDFWLNTDHNGIIGRKRMNTPDMVINFDGLSSTILASEVYWHKDRYISGTCSNRSLGWLSGWSSSITRMTKFTPRTDRKSNAARIDFTAFKEEYMFGSAHSSGLNVLFGDGAVKMIGYGVDEMTWWYMGQRNDGQVITIPE